MEFSGIAIFYLICLGTGFLFALLGAIFGELAGHGFEFGHDVDAGGGPELGGHEFDVASPDGMDMPGASFFNMITLSTFVAFFGLSGLMGLWVLRLSPLQSLVMALPIALAVAAAQFALYVKLFIKAQASSEATMSEILGCEAEVITTIPAVGMGEIAYVIKGTRYTGAAASSDEVEITRGTRVHVVNIRSNTLVVRPF